MNIFDFIIWGADVVVCLVLSLLAVEQLRLSCNPKNLKMAVYAVFPYKFLLLCIAMGAFSVAMSPMYAKSTPSTVTDLLTNSGLLGLFYVHFYGGIKWRRLRTQQKIQTSDTSS